MSRRSGGGRRKQDRTAVGTAVVLLEPGFETALPEHVLTVGRVDAHNGMVFVELPEADDAAVGLDDAALRELLVRDKRCGHCGCG